MSRIGKTAIKLDAKVKVSVSPEGLVVVTGPKGELKWTLPSGITLKLDGDTVTLARNSDERQVKALHGLSRSLVHNMVEGVLNGFMKDLEIQGVGFKAAVQGKVLNLSIGKSHPVLFPIPEGVKITVTENTKLKVEGANKQMVGQAAADIRGYYPPEPYKGKGIRYVGEQVRRKEGKTVQ